MYDLIGDIHGHADELVQLLEALGYEKIQDVYCHPERKVIFLGDFIDRGPQIRQVLEIVRPMIEQRKALTVMGNHELNALAYHTVDPHRPGEYLRVHSTKNEKQHRQTVEQLRPEELVSYLDWFRTLPLWLELEGLRVVHACWDDQAISRIGTAFKNHGEITTAFLESACTKGGSLYDAVEMILKGKEAALPNGVSFQDKDGTVRTSMRTRWYLSPQGQTYRTYALQSDELACDQKLDATVSEQAAPYPSSAKPVFVGHYWLWAQRPALLAKNVACLDYSVAKGGFLCAYRWDGKQNLSDDNFVWVDANPVFEQPTLPGFEADTDQPKESKLASRVHFAKELVVTLAAEGEGADIYRTRRDDGRWQFHAEGTTMTLDAEDGKDVHAWQSTPVLSIEEAVRPFGKTLLCCVPLSVHPDYRIALWRIAQSVARESPEMQGEVWQRQLRKWKRACSALS